MRLSVFKCVFQYSFSVCLLNVCASHCHPGVRFQTGKNTFPPHVHSKLQGIKKLKKIFLNPSRQLGFGGGRLPPPNPRSRAPWTLDLGGAEGEIGRWIWKFALKTLCCPPKSALQGALDVGFGGGRLPPPNPSWRLGFKNIFFLFQCAVEDG